MLINKYNSKKRSGVLMAEEAEQQNPSKKSNTNKPPFLHPELSFMKYN